MEHTNEPTPYDGVGPMTIEQQLNASGVADIIKDDAGFTDLKDLVNSDFDMDIDDQDYNLSMDELIKVAKILFHKINFQFF